KRIQPTLLRAEVEADREAGKTPSLFTAIRVHYDVEGDMEVKHLRQAIELSVEKYCSVGLMLGKAAPISYTFSLNGEHFDS
ncbi:MAG: OsmC family protein, partial [Bacteroidota bacterium]